MTAILQTKQESVAQLCARYHVARLELFGSAARGGVEPGWSDLDFLVRFQPCTPEDHPSVISGCWSTSRTGSAAGLIWWKSTRCGILTFSRASRPRGQSCMRLEEKSLLFDVRVSTFR